MLLARDVPRDGRARRHLGFRLERGQIRRDGLPVHIVVRRTVHVLRCVIDDVRVVGRNVDGGGSLEAVGQVGGVPSVEVPRAHVVLLLLVRAPAVPAEPSFAVGVDDVRVARLGHGGARLAPSNGAPVGGVSRGGVVGLAAGHRDRGVVLLAGVQPVQEAVVDVDLVELRCLLVVLRGPGLAAVPRDVGAPIVRLDEKIRVVGVDPHVVVVTVRASTAAPNPHPRSWTCRSPRCSRRRCPRSSGQRPVRCSKTGGS